MVRRIFAVLVGITAAVAVSVLPVAAGTVVGTYTIADHGQGGWGGGPLYTDGSIGGGGALSYFDGQEVGVVTGGVWKLNSHCPAGTIDILAGAPATGTGNGLGDGFTLVLKVRAIKDPLGQMALPLCFSPLPLGGPVVVQGTTIRVSIQR